jgi:hypothetical protein
MLLSTTIFDTIKQLPGRKEKNNKQLIAVAIFIDKYFIDPMKKFFLINLHFIVLK